MAAFDNTSRVRLLHAREVPYDEYRGTKDELIAAGLATDGMFPGDPGGRKTMVTHKGPPKVCIARRNKSVLVLQVDVDDEERERRLAVLIAKQQVERALDDEHNYLEAIAGSPDDFRHRAISWLRANTQPGRDFLAVLGAGYHFAPDAMQDFEDSLAEAIAELQAAPILFRASERRAAIAKVKLQTAQADPAYQATLAAIVATAAP